MMAMAMAMDAYGRGQNEFAEILVVKAGRYLDEAAALEPLSAGTLPSGQEAQPPKRATSATAEPQKDE
jgi:hypothetical protein